MRENNLILGKWNFIFLLGESGGGKGTLVSNFKNYWLPDLKTGSMGDIFREKAKVEPEIKALTEQGILIGDDIAMRVFRDFAIENSPALIDGYPRNREQAIDAIKFIKENGWRVLVIDLHCDIEVILERLLARGRADDKLEIMYKRNLDHRTLHPKVMKEIKNRTDLFDVINVNGHDAPEKICTDFLLAVFSLVDMLYLYDNCPIKVDFDVKGDETTIYSGLNRWIGDVLKKIQTEIDKGTYEKHEDTDSNK